MPKALPVRVVDRRFAATDNERGNQPAQLAYTTPPAFATGQLLGASALNVLTDDIAWLQGHRSKRSAPQPMCTAPDQTWRWRYMCVHRFDTLALSYTIAGADADADPAFILYNSDYPSGEDLAAYVNEVGGFPNEQGTYTRTVDLSGLGIAVGSRYRILIEWDPDSTGKWELLYLYEDNS